MTVDNTAIVSLPGLDPLGGNFVFVLCFPFFIFMCMPKKIIMILVHRRVILFHILLLTLKLLVVTEKNFWLKLLHLVMKIFFWKLQDLTE